MSESTSDKERAALLASLEVQRRHVLGILEGLDDDALRRPVLPSGWTPLGLVNHLALDVERWWFRAVVAGKPGVMEGAPENAWLVPDDVPTGSVLELYRREVEQANTVIGATAVTTSPAWWPDEMFPGFRLDDLREVMLHVITETAAHAGHLDAARELIDGRQWIVLT